MGIGSMMAGGLGNRQQNDFYSTPKNVTQALLNVWKPPAKLVWECACGIGEMSEVLKGNELEVISTDLIDRGYGEGNINFLQQTEKRADVIITNPPFDLAEFFIRRALENMQVKALALVLKSTYWHAASRHWIFQRFEPKFIMPLLWRPDFMGLGRPTMEIQWCVWDNSITGRPQYIPLKRP